MKSRKGQVFINILLVIAVLVFLLSGYKLYQVFSEYQKGANEYDALRKVALGLDVPKATKPQEKFVPANVDFSALQKMNGDIVAWIQFEEPAAISYPVVRGEDNNKYLHTTFAGERNAAGTLFMDAGNDALFLDFNTLIYGHNMKNGSMFGQLRKYKKQDFYEKYPYFYIQTPDGRIATYKIFAVSIVEDDSKLYQKWCDTTEECASYIQLARSEALYPTGVEVPEGARIVSLSTCTNVKETERLLVQGVLVEED